MDASRKIQRGIHVQLIQFLMCPESWVHITFGVPCLVFLLGCFATRPDMHFGNSDYSAAPQFSQGAPVMTT